MTYIYLFAADSNYSAVLIADNIFFLPVSRETYKANLTSQENSANIAMLLVQRRKTTLTAPLAVPSKITLVGLSEH